MDLRDFGSTLARWRHLTLITLLAAIGAGIGLFNATSPTYTANSTVLLMPPKAVLVQAQADKSQYAPNNPLLYLDTLTNSRDVLVRNLSSKDVQDFLEKQQPATTTTVSGDMTSNSPLIIVKSTGSSEAAALSAMEAVDALVPYKLKSMQDEMDIQPLQRISSMVVTADTKATASSKKQLELGIVGFALVLLLGLGLIALLDQLRTRRLAKAGTMQTAALSTDEAAPAVQAAQVGASAAASATTAAAKNVRKGNRA